MANDKNQLHSSKQYSEIINERLEELDFTAEEMMAGTEELEDRMEMVKDLCKHVGFKADWVLHRFHPVDRGGLIEYQCMCDIFRPVSTKVEYSPLAILVESEAEWHSLCKIALEFCKQMDRE